MRRWIGSPVFGVLVGVLLVVACAPQAAQPAAPEKRPALQQAPVKEGEFHMKFAVNNAEKTSKGTQEKTIADLIRKKSNGRVSVEIFWEGALGQEQTAIEAVGNRSVEMAIASTSNYSSIVRPWTAMDLPFLIINGYDGWQKLIRGEAYKELEAVSEKQGFKNVGYVIEGFRNLYTTKRQIKTPGEMRGIKLRTTPSPIEAAYVGAFGGSPTVVAWPETYLALKQGIVEGYHVAYSSVVQFKMSDAIKYATETEVVPIISVVVMNNEHFKALPADVQQAIMAAKAESTALNFAEDIRAEGEFKKTLEQDFKVVTYRPSADEHKQWRDTVGGVYQKFADIVSSEWVAKAQSAMR